MKQLIIIYCLLFYGFSVSLYVLDLIFGKY